MTMFFGVVFAAAIGLEPQSGVVVLPLLATQLLWINLITDGPPALALGLDPPDPMVMADANTFIKGTIGLTLPPLK